jgi:hypothetical protein
LFTHNAKFGAKSGRKNPKDKMRQYEKNQVKQDGKKINNTSQKSPQTNDANILHFYGSAYFVYVFWFNKYGVVASS